MKLFYRDGYELSESNVKKVVMDANWEAGTLTIDRACSRCGGYGGNDAWKHTGWTCYRCNGATHRLPDGRFSDPAGPEKIRVYSEVKLQKLKDAEAKRIAKKEAKLKAAEDAFRNEYVSIIETAEYYGEKNSFIRDVIATCLGRNSMSERQECALINAFQKAQSNLVKAAAADFVGKIGDKMKRKLTLKWEKAFPGAWRSTYYISTYVDAEGNIFTYKGASPKGAIGEEAEYSFTIKEHETYNDRKSNIISRIKQIKE